MNLPLTVGLVLFLLAAALIGVGVMLAVSGDPNAPLVIAVFVTSAVLELTGMALILRGWLAGTAGGMAPNRGLWGEVLYGDRLLRVYETGLWFPRFYFPWGAKFVPFAEIERIECLPPTLWTGKWRMWGSGDLVTWFPLDPHRNRRDMIFQLYPSAGGWRIGFTAEDSGQVREVLRRRITVEERGT